MSNFTGYGEDVEAALNAIPAKLIGTNHDAHMLILALLDQAMLSMNQTSEIHMMLMERADELAYAFLRRKVG